MNSCLWLYLYEAKEQTKDMANEIRAFHFLYDEDWTERGLFSGENEPCLEIQGKGMAGKR